MFSTTTLIALQIVSVKHLPVILALAFFIFFGFFDGVNLILCSNILVTCWPYVPSGLFWGAALKKVPEGAWVPLIIGIILYVILLKGTELVALFFPFDRVSVMVFWTWAKVRNKSRFPNIQISLYLTVIQSLEDEFDGTNRRNLRHMIVRKEIEANLPLDTPSEKHSVEYPENVTQTLEDRSGTPRDIKYYILEETKSPLQGLELDSAKASFRELARIPTCAIFHKFTIGRGVPHTFISEFYSHLSPSYWI